MQFSKLMTPIICTGLLAVTALPALAGTNNDKAGSGPMKLSESNAPETTEAIPDSYEEPLQQLSPAAQAEVEAASRAYWESKFGPISGAAAIPPELDWSAANQAKIDTFFKATDLKGKVAVFDADDTLWRHDVGEGFLKYLQERNKLVMVPPGFDAFARYEALCAQNKWMGYPYAAQVMAGMKESDVKALAKDFFENHFKQNVYPAQQALIKRLQAAGVEVYIVSASNQWIVEAGAPTLGVPLDHVIGVRLDVVDSLVTANIVPPMTFRQGKVDAIQKYIKAQPVLVSGDSITDYEMLKYASRLQLVINPKDKNAPAENIFRLASEHGWPIQRW